LWRRKLDVALRPQARESSSVLPCSRCYGARRGAGVLRELYTGVSETASPLDRLVSAEQPGIEGALGEMEKRGLEPAVKALRALQAQGGVVVRYSECRIHGDLHLGNMMLGKTDLLVDFAHAKVGARVRDLAKLVVDAQCRFPKLRARPEDLRAGRILPRELANLLMKCLPFKGDDRLTWLAFVVVHACKYLTYDGVDAGAARYLLSICKAASMPGYYGDRAR